MKDKSDIQLVLSKDETGVLLMAIMDEIDNLYKVPDISNSTVAISASYWIATLERIEGRIREELIRKEYLEERLGNSD